MYWVVIRAKDFFFETRCTKVKRKVNQTENYDIFYDKNSEDL